MFEVRRQILRNGQITLPKKALQDLDLSEHDLLDVKYDAAGIYLRPLVVDEFSEVEYDALERKLDSLKNKKTKGKAYQTTSEARKHLERLSKDHAI